MQNMFGVITDSFSKSERVGFYFNQGILANNVTYLRTQRTIEGKSYCDVFGMKTCSLSTLLFWNQFSLSVLF